MLGARCHCQPSSSQRKRCARSFVVTISWLHKVTDLYRRWALVPDTRWFGVGASVQCKWWASYFSSFQEGMHEKSGKRAICNVRRSSLHCSQELLALFEGAICTVRRCFLKPIAIVHAVRFLSCDPNATPVASLGTATHTLTAVRATWCPTTCSQDTRCAIYSVVIPMTLDTASHIGAHPWFEGEAIKSSTMIGGAKGVQYVPLSIPWLRISFVHRQLRLLWSASYLWSTSSIALTARRLFHYRIAPAVQRYSLENADTHNLALENTHFKRLSWFTT
jgi:hypothetical protein